MSKNIDQIFTANPITSNASTDLMYFGQSPYGSGDDAAMTYANFSAQFAEPFTILPVSRGGTDVASFNIHGIVISGATSTAALSSLTLTNGQVVIGSTGATPLAATLTAGIGIGIANAANSITISSNGANPWVDETSASITMTTNTGYTSDNGATLVTFALPIASAIGDWVEVNGKGSGGWSISQATGQQIHFGNQTTTSGASGSLSSINQYDCVRLRCLTANTIWTVVSTQSSSLTVV